MKYAPWTTVLRLARRTYHGWWVVGGTFLLQTLQAALFFQAFGTYSAVWHRDFGWSTTAVAGLYTLKQLANAAISPFQIWLLRRLRVRDILRIGIILVGLGLVGIATSKQAWSFLLAFVLTSAGLSLCGFLPLSTAIVDWFERRRATAMALMQTGISIGGLLVAPITLAIVHFGWRLTMGTSGILFVLVGMPVAALFATPPHSSESTAQPGAGLPIVDPDFTASSTLRTPSFWWLSVGHAAALLVVASVTVHLVVYLVDAQGYSLAHTGVIIAVMTACAGVGQVLGGFLGDRFDKRHIAASAMGGHAVAVVALGLAGVGPLMVYAFAVIHGLSWGIRGPQMQTLRADFFGRRAFALVMGLSVPLITVGQVLGPMAVGVIRDTTGHYGPGLVAIGAGAIAGAFAFLVARPPDRLTKEAATR